MGGQTMSISKVGFHHTDDTFNTGSGRWETLLITAQKPLLKMSSN